MADERLRGAGVLSHLAIPIFATTVLAASFLMGDIGTSSSATAWTPVGHETKTDSRGNRTSTAHLLAFNDLHGAIDPPSGSSGMVNGVPAGGMEYLATHIKRLRANAARTSDAVFTVSAGDLIGASPLVSAAFHDEPTIEIMNAIKLDYSAIGNHEFDEGLSELRRLDRGGCHPTDGCADGDGFSGAQFTFLGANVVQKTSRKPAFTPVSIRKVGGVPIGFVGISLESTPSIVNPAGVASVTFRPETQVANEYADILARQGVHSLVLLLHNGGSQNTAAGTATNPSGCEGFTGPITDVVKGLRKEYGVVVSGHTHRSYACSLSNASGEKTLVTSAGSYGTMVTDISVSVDRRSKRFTSATATNVTVDNGIRNDDGTWAKNADGTYARNPRLVDPKVKAIADKYRTAVAPLANRVVGSITADITNNAVASGESPLGDVIADAQLAYTSSQGAQIALMNPGGIRGPLTYANSPGGENPGEITYGECFTTQPFNNLVVTQTFTGANLKEILEQQFAGYAGQTTTRILQISAGLTYEYDSTAPLGQRIANLAFNGIAIDPTSSYRVTTNDFLANGGDGFSALTRGVDRSTAPGFDIDALVSYLGTGPIAPGPANRVTKRG